MPQTGKTSQFILRGFFVISIFFFSCATVFPFDSSQEQAVVFDTIDVIRPLWRNYSEGISYIYGKVTTPQLEFWAMRIDLHSPNTRIVVKGGLANSDGKGGALTTKVSSFVRDNNLNIGINALPFDVSTATEGQPIRNLGVVISDGQLIAPANRHYDALVFYNDGRAAIIRQAAMRTAEGIENIENAVGGFYQILSDGEPSRRTITSMERHPRSAAGVSDRGDRLYLLVIDGRRNSSSGGTERETARILRSLGAWDGINFDGGGSTTLAIRNSDGRVRVANTPIHGGILGRERAVAGCIGVQLVEVNPSTER
jgi:exopolysaccharide biosynthesis protein